MCYLCSAFLAALNDICLLGVGVLLEGWSGLVLKTNKHHNPLEYTCLSYIELNPERFALQCLFYNADTHFQCVLCHNITR